MSEDKLNQIHSEVLLIKQAVYGEGDVKGIAHRINALEDEAKEFTSFKTRTLAIAGVFGVIGGGIVTFLAGVFR